MANVLVIIIYDSQCRWTPRRNVRKDKLRSPIGRYGALDTASQVSGVLRPGHVELAVWRAHLFTEIRFLDVRWQFR